VGEPASGPLNVRSPVAQIWIGADTAANSCGKVRKGAERCGKVRKGAERCGKVRKGAESSPCYWQS